MKKNKWSRVFKDQATIEPFLNIKQEFKAEVNGDEATLYVYGDIGESWWDETSTSAIDVKNFLETNSAKTINVRVNSLGGDVFDGIAIYNQLKSHDAKIIMHIDGIAASAASIIAMAGDEIHMPKTSMLMIHNAWTFAYGNAKDFRKVAEDLDKIGNAIVEGYLTRFVGSREELETLLDDETFLNADEAIAFGLADEVVEPITVDTEPVKNRLLAKYSAHSKPRETPKVNTNEESKKTIISQFKRAE